MLLSADPTFRFSAPSSAREPTWNLVGMSTLLLVQNGVSGSFAVRWTILTMLALFPVTGCLTIQMVQKCGERSCGILSHRGGRFTEPVWLLPPVNSVFWQLPVLRGMGPA